VRDVGETSWTFLLLGSFAALGAALAIGTLGAIARYHRTGAFPGDEDGTAGPVPRGRLLALWVRVGLGVVLTGIGIWALGRAGLL
jgi:hypothetical protein